MQPRLAATVQTLDGPRHAVLGTQQKALNTLTASSARAQLVAYIALANAVVPLFLEGDDNTRFFVIALLMPATRFIMGKPLICHNVGTVEPIPAFRVGR